MFQLRISKYNPKYRDLSGSYCKEDWTSVSDIHKIFDGKKLTISKYLEVEGNYLDCFIQLMNISSISCVSVSNIKDTAIHEGLSDELRKESLQYYEEFSKSKRNTFSDKILEKLVRLILREVLWCKFSGNNGFYAHFGYDYYMYIGANTGKLESLVIPKGIFVEKDFSSPYI